MSNNETNRDEVVFKPVESKIIPGYFIIPSHPEYLASPDGRIWYLRAGREMRQRRHGTSVGSYLAISVRVGVKFRHALVHLLVAEAFLGPPEGQRMFVNHKDGDKHNNHWKNLEWVTRSENLIHAYKTGLRSDKRGVLMLDHESGEVTEFFSMNAVGRHFGWKKNEIWRLLRDHQNSKYHDRFTFVFPTDNYTVRRRTSKEDGGVTRVIVAKNYLENKVVIAPDQGTAELLTGIKRATINFTLQLAKTPYQLIRGWVFKYLDDPADFPEYSDELVQASMLGRSAVGQPIQVKNRSTNTTELHASLAAFAKSLDEHPNTIRRALERSPGKFKDFDIIEVV